MATKQISDYLWGGGALPAEGEVKFMHPIPVIHIREVLSLYSKNKTINEFVMEVLNENRQEGAVQIMGMAKVPYNQSMRIYPFCLSAALHYTADIDEWRGRYSLNCGMFQVTGEYVDGYSFETYISCQVIDSAYEGYWRSNLMPLLMADPTTVDVRLVTSDPSAEGIEKLTELRVTKCANRNFVGKWQGMFVRKDAYGKDLTGQVVITCNPEPDSTGTAFLFGLYSSDIDDETDLTFKWETIQDS